MSISHSADETHALGVSLGRQLAPNSVVCFYGDLGSGKTTFIKGLAEGVLGTPAEEINSPTFTYLNIHRGTTTLYHFDLYRLRDVDEFLGMGFDEMFDAGGICCIEWAEKIASLDIPQSIHIKMSYLGAEKRRIDIRTSENNGQMRI